MKASIRTMIRWAGDRFATGSLSGLYMLCLVLLFAGFVLSPSDVRAKDWVAEEGEPIVNGKTSGSATANAPGEVSVEWESKATSSASYNSPSSPVVATVDHRSQVRLDTPTLPDGTLLTEGDSITLEPGDTVDVGVRLTNTGNGSDTYSLRGRFIDGGTQWDTEIFVDVDGDSSGAGESSVDQVGGLAVNGEPDDDTGLVLRVSVPTNASTSDSRPIALTAESLRTEDPSPGSDSSVFRVAVAGSGGTTSITLSSLSVEGPYSSLLADGSDTVAVRGQWRNAGSQAGTVRTDTDDLQFRNPKGAQIRGFDVSLIGDTKLTVPGDSVAESNWVIHAPDTNNKTLPGIYQVNFDGSDTQEFLNVASAVGTVTNSGGSIDSWAEDLRSISIKAGVPNGSPAMDPDLVGQGDELAVMYQRGDSTFIDTPLVSPGYEFESNGDLRKAVAAANEKLKDSLDDPLNDTLMNISIWKESVGGTYLGTSEVLDEDVRVSIEKPRPDLEDVKVAKLLPGTNEWHVIDEDPELGFNQMTFTVQSESDQKGTGFSVFRLVTGPPVSEVKSADETVVYPNPFIPYDGDPETGEYGLGEDQGIYFSTGEKSGFAAGTEVTIYTVTGELVAEVRTNTIGRIQWDGRTREGDYVASGTYVYRITTPDGSEKVGKFSVVR